MGFILSKVTHISLSRTLLKISQVNIQSLFKEYKLTFSKFLEDLWATASGFNRGVFRTKSNISYFCKNIPSEMFVWGLNTLLIFKHFSVSLFYDKINFQINHSSRGICVLCNIYMFVLKATFLFISIFLGRSSSECALVSSVLQY